MRRLFLVGIGTGRPEQITVEAIETLNQLDVVFLLDKGPGPRQLNDLRRQICERYITNPAYRIVEVPDPPRDREASAYRDAVDAWTEARAALYERLLREELDEDGRGGILVWGDPSLYDGALRVVEKIAAASSLPFDYAVIPGVSSIQVLAARHRVSLTRVGRPVQVTTGRRLGDDLPDDSDDVVVMLDGECSFQRLRPEGLQIFWGAYLGSEDELLVAGPLAEVADRIVELRQRARAEKGWIMDTYLLRRSG